MDPCADYKNLRSINIRCTSVEPGTVLSLFGCRSVHMGPVHFWGWKRPKRKTLWVWTPKGVSHSRLYYKTSWVNALAILNIYVPFSVRFIITQKNIANIESLCFVERMEMRMQWMWYTFRSSLFCICRVLCATKFF